MMRKLVSAGLALMMVLLAASPALAQTFVSGNYACRSPWSFATESKVLGRTHHWLEPPTGSLYHYWPLDANGSNQYYTYKKFWSYSAPGSQYWWVVVEGTDPTGSSSYGSVYCWQ